jgi:glutathione peroxidase
MAKSVSDITVQTITGEPRTLGDYQGNVLLIVNVASYCGYTSQYRGLEALNQKYRSQGLRILGFPCNDFGAQEPGTNEEIQRFCDRNYSITFELFDKIHVIGADQHPLYARLTTAVEPTGAVSWNFEKFLVNKQREAIARYRSGVTPDAKELVSAIEQELAK